MFDYIVEHLVLNNIKKYSNMEETVDDVNVNSSNRIYSAIQISNTNPDVVETVENDIFIYTFINPKKINSTKLENEN